MITLQFKDTAGLVEFVRSLDGHGLTVDADDEDLREYLSGIKPDGKHERRVQPHCVNHMVFNYDCKACERLIRK